MTRTFSGGEKTLIAENMRKIFVISVVVSLLVLSVSISSVHAYTNAIYSFSIDPPNGWTVDDTVSYAAVVFYGPIDQDFRVNVNIQVEPTRLSLVEYTSHSKLQLQSLESYQLLSEGSRTINGVDASELVVKFSLGGTIVPGNIVQEKIVTILENGKAFIIVYAALPTTYQIYLNAFESSVQTLKVEAAYGAFALFGLDWTWIQIIIIVAVVAGVGSLAIYNHRKYWKKTAPSHTT